MAGKYLKMRDVSRLLHSMYTTKTVLTIQSSDHIRAMLEPDYKSCICIYYC